jgi:rhamnosyltransferase subunit B
VVRLVLELVERVMLDPVVRPAINRLRATLNLAPVRRVMSRWLHSPQQVICAFPAWFAAPQPDWPPNTVCTGFPRMPASEGQLDPDLQRFIDAGAAPVVVTPGSAMAHGGVFIGRALDAAQALGLRVVVVTPYREQLPAVLPPSVHHAAYAPFDLLAPRAAAFVHHGGIGTSATVLAAGKPQLVVPFAFDQPDNAARLRRLGVAATVLPNAPLRAWIKALSSLLNDPQVSTACGALAAAMALETPAAEQIADIILEQAV